MGLRETRSKVNYKTSAAAKVSTRIVEISKEKSEIHCTGNTNRTGNQMNVGR